MRIGCSTIPLAPLSGEEALRRIADLGFSVVDIAAVPMVFDHILTIDAPPNQPEQFRALIEELGLEVSGVPTVVWAPDKLDDLAEVRRRCTAAADVAAAVGAKSWIVDAGQPVGNDRAKGLARFKRTIAMQHELAVERGLRLTVEAPHAGTLAERYSGVADVLEAAAEAGADVALDFDTSHIYNCGASAEQAISDYGDRVAHVAIRDTTGPRAWGMPLGEGHFDFRSFADLLEAAGFEGDLMLELEPATATVDERIALIEHGRDYLHKVLLDPATGPDDATRRSDR